MAIRPNAILTQARSILQDTVEPYRFTDDVLIGHLNMGLREARRIRPDIFLSIWGPIVDVTSGSLATPIDIEDQFEPAFTHYVVGMAEMSLDEFTQDGRAVVMTARMSSMLQTQA